jgi:hypothetical protein
MLKMYTKAILFSIFFSFIIGVSINSSKNFINAHYFDRDLLIDEEKLFFKTSDVNIYDKQRNHITDFNNK